MSLLRLAISALLLGLALGLVGYYYGFSGILDTLLKLSPSVVGAVLLALLANAFAAAFRFHVVATDTGHPIGFRRAMAAVGAGSLAGAAFFQLAGQLMARGVIARRGGMPFAAVLAVTLYERIVAAIMSGLLALGGALFIFGNIYLNQEAGGAALIMIMCGLIAAAMVGALIGYGAQAARTVAPLITRWFVRACVRIVAATLMVQMPMMAAYVMATHALSPQIPIADLVAASAVVMFAASVPISLAGWGVRELSAIVALGAIGMPTSDALTAAVIIGVMSMLSMATLALVSSFGSRAPLEPKMESSSVNSVDYTRALAWVLPIAAAVFVLFQIYVPIGTGLLNVNLADPLAMLAASLFVLEVIVHKRLPRWRVQHINLSVAIATAVLAGSLLIGAARFGWTEWAVVNRFLGWFVLLCFATTGALIVLHGGREGFKVLLLTYVGASASIVIIDLVLILTRAIGIAISAHIITPYEIDGFAQNRNAFAFQLLMAAVAALAMIRSPKLRITVLTILLLGLWFAGSRSGWGAIVCVLGGAVYLRVSRGREVGLALAFAAASALAVAFLPDLIALMHSGVGAGKMLAPQLVPTASSTNERLVSIFGGLDLFRGHPIFGAGLGAFRKEMILSSEGIPLIIHSTEVWLLAELGLVGLLVFAVPGCYVWITEWLRARQDRVSAVIALCFVAFAVMSAPADMMYQRTFWLLLGAGLAVPHVARLQKDAPEGVSAAAGTTP